MATLNGPERTDYLKNLVDQLEADDMGEDLMDNGKGQEPTTSDDVVIVTSSPSIYKHTMGNPKTQRRKRQREKRKFTLLSESSASSFH